MHMVSACRFCSDWFWGYRADMTEVSWEVHGEAWERMLTAAGPYARAESVGPVPEPALCGVCSQPGSGEHEGFRIRYEGRGENAPKVGAARFIPTRNLRPGDILRDGETWAIKGRVHDVRRNRDGSVFIRYSDRPTGLDLTMTAHGTRLRWAELAD